MHIAQSASNISHISIYKTSNFTVRITGLPQGEVSIAVFNILGKQIIAASFPSKNNKDVPLPQLAAGIYNVKL